MNVLVPVAAFHEYNTARYVASALIALGHRARVITQAEYYADHSDADLFFCVDSAGPLDFPEKHRAKSAMWFIDARHNNDPARRRPDDDTNARRLADGGGWVFQAQRQDWERNVSQGITRASWLPLAADPDVWCTDPNATKHYDVAFGGNIWDGERRALLDRIARKWTLSAMTGRPEDLAYNYGAARVGFNVSSFYGSPVAYDVNMRVFEVLSCGVPLVTNDLDDLPRLGILPGYHCLTYRDHDDALTQIGLALSRGETWRREMGQRARGLILEGHTYRHRMSEALEILCATGMIG
jgi:hypothetical protein